jgi:hypothetical protein
MNSFRNLRKYRLFPPFPATKRFRLSKAGHLHGVSGPA